MLQLVEINKDIREQRSDSFCVWYYHLSKEGVTLKKENGVKIIPATVNFLSWDMNALQFCETDITISTAESDYDERVRALEEEVRSLRSLITGSSLRSGEYNDQRR